MASRKDTAHRSVSSLLLASAPLLVALFLGLIHSVTKPSFPVPPSGSAVVITGSSTGIGRHSAAGLAAAGFLVFAGVRRVRDVETLVEAYPGRVFPLLLDVTDHDGGVMRAAEEVRETLDDMGGKVKLAGLVNNAGIGEFGREFDVMKSAILTRSSWTDCKQL